MKVIILVDMEGATGIDDSCATWLRCNSPDWETHGRDAITADVLSVVQGCKEAGVEEVLICDAHDQGTSIRRNKIKVDGVKIGFQTQVWGLDLTVGFDYAIMVGFHPMTQREGVIPHSFRFDIAEITCNGKPIGELAGYMGWFAENGIRTIMVTGDEHAIREAQAINPALVGVVVKTWEETGVRHLDRDTASALLRKRTKEALVQAPAIPLLQSDELLQITLRPVNEDYLAGFGTRKGIEVLGEQLKWVDASYGDFIRSFFKLIPWFNEEVTKMELANRQFMMKMVSSYPRLREKGQEIHQIAGARGLTKPVMLFSEANRKEYLEVIQQVLGTKPVS